MVSRVKQAISGERELLKALKGIDEAMIDKVAPAGMRGYLRVTAKAIKGEVPGKFKSARKGIGSRFVKKDKRTKKVVAKAGSQVAIKKQKRIAWGEQAKAKRGNKPGVGISANNIHWAILGTSQRTQEKTGRSTGKMEPLFPNVVRTGVLKSKSAALAKFRLLSKKELVKQVEKYRQKVRKRSR